MGFCSLKGVSILFKVTEVPHHGSEQGRPSFRLGLSAPVTMVSEVYDLVPQDFGDIFNMLVSDGQTQDREVAHVGACPQSQRAEGVCSSIRRAEVQPSLNVAEVQIVPGRMAVTEMHMGKQDTAG